MPILPNPWIMLGALVGVLILCAVSFERGHHYATLQAQEALVEAQNKVIAAKDQQAAITGAVEGAAAVQQAQIRTITKEVIRNVPVYITRKSDAECTVPVGAVRVFAAAARGVRDLPDPAGRPDDAAAGIDLSALAAAGADDLGTCQGVRAQLTSLQDWIGQQAHADGPPAGGYTGRRPGQ